MTDGRYSELISVRPHGFYKDCYIITENDGIKGLRITQVANIPGGAIVRTDAVPTTGYNLKSAQEEFRNFIGVKNIVDNAGATH